MRQCRVGRNLLVQSSLCKGYCWCHPSGHTAKRILFSCTDCFVLYLKAMTTWEFWSWSCLRRSFRWVAGVPSLPWWQGSRWSRSRHCQGAVTTVSQAHHHRVPSPVSPHSHSRLSVWLTAVSPQDLSFLLLPVFQYHLSCTTMTGTPMSWKAEEGCNHLDVVILAVYGMWHVIEGKIHIQETS